MMTDLLGHRCGSALMIGTRIPRLSTPSSPSCLQPNNFLFLSLITCRSCKQLPNQQHLRHPALLLFLGFHTLSALLLLCLDEYLLPTSPTCYIFVPACLHACLCVFLLHDWNDNDCTTRFTSCVIVEQKTWLFFISPCGLCWRRRERGL
jgi:hypothetical protein